jgi:DNA-binding protein YbaB
MSAENKPSEQQLVNQIKDSIAGMQDEMQATYAKLSGEEVIGKSGETPNPYVQIIMKANYDMVDLMFEKEALQGGVNEFKFRIKAAWKDALQQIQQITQARTMELLQGMNIPNDLQGLNQDQIASDDDQE